MGSSTASQSDKVTDLTSKNMETSNEKADKHNYDVENSAVEVAEMEVVGNNEPLDWASATDPENPHNWSVAKKSFHRTAAFAMITVVLMGSSIYLPAYPQVSEKFHVGNTAAILPFTTYVFDLSFGPMLAAPISETKGRHFVYLVTMPIYGLSVVGCALAPNLPALVILRFLAGMFGSPPLAEAAGTVADLYDEEERCKPVSGICRVGFFWDRTRVGLRWCHWTLLFFVVASYSAVLLMKETWKKAILRARTRRLGITVPENGPKGAAALKFIMTVTVTRAFVMLFTEPVVAFLSLYVVANFSTIYCFMVAFPIVFTTQYGFSSEQDGLPFLAIASGAYLGALLSILSDHFLYQPLIRASKAPHSTVKVVPEMPLYGALIACFFPPIGLFWFGWSARSDISWASPVIASIPITAGFTTIFISVALYLLDGYVSLLGASAMAANGILRHVVGGVSPLFTEQMVTNLGIGWTGSLLGFLSLAMMLLPWIFWKWGAAIRGRSKYGRVGV